MQSIHSSKARVSRSVPGLAPTARAGKRSPNVPTAAAKLPLEPAALLLVEGVQGVRARQGVQIGHGRTGLATTS
jgi:hypothetical protein